MVKLQVNKLTYRPLSKTVFKGRLWGFSKFVAEKMAERVKAHIEKQEPRLKWKPLSKAYLRRKIRLGYDKRILIASGQYIDSIYVYRSDKAYVVGVRPRIHMGAKGLSEGGMKMSLLAKWLEFGTRKMPARPHWRPAFFYVRKNIAKYFHEYMKARWT
jgi:ribosomal protein S30